jgi:hypothetical protein
MKIWLTSLFILSFLLIIIRISTCVIDNNCKENCNTEIIKCGVVKKIHQQINRGEDNLYAQIQGPAYADKYTIKLDTFVNIGDIACGKLIK